MSYTVRPVLCVLVLSVLVSASCAVAAEERDVQWTGATTATLHWGDSYQRGTYTLTCTNLPKLNEKGEVSERFVGLELYVGGVLVHRLVLGEGGQYEYGDELKITVMSIHAVGKTFESEVYDPYTVIKTEVRAYPALTVSMSTDRTSYPIPDEPAPDEEKRIVLTVGMKNTGKADLYGCKMEVDTGELTLISGNTHPYVSHIAKGDGVSYTLIFELPYPETMEESLITRAYTVKVSAEGAALKGEQYRASASHSISVLPVWTSKDVRFVKRCYPSWVRVNDTVGVRLYIENNGIYPLNNIHITDTPSSRLKMERPESLSWNVSLAQGESAEFSYSMKLEYGLWMSEHASSESTTQQQRAYPPGIPPSEIPPEYWQQMNQPTESASQSSVPSKLSITLPQASASFVLAGSEYSLSSNSPSTKVYLPNVSVKKSASTTTALVGEELTVNVSTVVLWDMRAKVDMSDSLPTGAVLVSGNLTDHAIMRKGESRTLSYTLRFDEAGSYTLPPAYVSFENLQNYNSTVFSAPLNITVVVPSQHREQEPPTPAEPSPPDSTDADGSLPGFEALVCACSLIIALVCRRLLP